jgi:hypothetical protein
MIRAKVATGGGGGRGRLCCLRGSQEPWLRKNERRRMDNETSRRVASLLAVLAPLAGCAFVQPTAQTQQAQPTVRTQRVSSMPADDAIRAATQAARDTNWIVKTIDKDTGHILADRGIRVLERPEKVDSYEMEVAWRCGATEIANALPTAVYLTLQKNV